MFVSVLEMRVWFTLFLKETGCSRPEQSPRSRELTQRMAVKALDAKRLGPGNVPHGLTGHCLSGQ